MALATATADGRPSVRIVLLKGVDGGGFVFYTNYDSRKARDIAATGHAACCSTGRRSIARCASAAASRRCRTRSRTPTSRTRPVESRWSVVRVEAERGRCTAARRSSRATTPRVQRYGEQVPRPAWWGGYRVIPDEFEFWQGRRAGCTIGSRYAQGDGWRRERLAP